MVNKDTLSELNGELTVAAILVTTIDFSGIRTHDSLSHNLPSKHRLLADIDFYR